MKNNVLTFIEDTHEYFLGNLPIPPVTRVIKEACFPDMYEGIPKAVLEHAAERGKAVHWACWYFDQDDLDEGTLHPEVAPYLEGWKKWRASTPAAIEAIEAKIYSRKLWLAGQTDRVMVIEGARWIIDIKSGQLTPEALASTALQTAAYLTLWNERNPKQKVTRRGSVYLTAEGNYDFHSFDDPTDIGTLIKVVDVWKWKNRRIEQNNKTTKKG